MTAEVLEQRIESMALQLDEIHRALFHGEKDRGGVMPRLSAVERSNERLWRLVWAVVGAGGLGLCGLAFKLLE